MRHGQSKKIALCGVIGALAMTVMLMGSILPLAVFCAPALAGLLFLPVQDSYGIKTALTLYAGVGILGIILLPDKESAGCFVFVLGYYPVLKQKLDRIPSVVLRTAAKLLIFNVSVALMYAVLLTLFPLAPLREEYQETGEFLAAATLIVANIAFLVYDQAVARMSQLHRLVIKPKLKRYF